MQKIEERPPYVDFRLLPVEDRNATIEAGHYVAKDKAFVHVTPAGSKDVVVRDAEEWLASQDEAARQGRIPAAWATQFRAAYDMWTKTQEVPLFGTSVRNWPSASPAQVQTLLRANILTVEDLAAANESAIGRLGMGGRALKELAVAWLASSADAGKLAERHTALEIENTALKEQVSALAASVQALEARLGTPSPQARTAARLQQAAARQAEEAEITTPAA